MGHSTSQQREYVLKDKVEEPTNTLIKW
jgi:hypothetical protein